MLKTFEIVLDLEKDLYTPANLLFTVSRNDFQSIELQFTIRQDEKPVDLTGQTVEMAIKKPSGLVVYQPVEIKEAQAGKAAARLSIQAYVEYGLHTAELYIRDIDSLAVTMPFFFASNESIMEAEAIESVNDWSALQQALFSYDKKPIMVDGIPEDVLPEYVGQMAIDPIGRQIFIAYDVTATGWDLFAAGDGSGGGLIYWDNILQKPAAFPPEIHTHDFIDIQGKPAAYPPEDHDHLITDVTGLQAALDAKANTGELGAPVEHTHEIAEVNGLQTALDGKADDADLAAKADLNHNHAITNVTGLQAELDGKADAAHNHTIDNVVGLQNSLDGKASTIDLAAKADLNHAHTITDVTGLQTSLDGKADDGDLAAFITEADADLKYAIKGDQGGTIAAAWGDIAGTLANQADLQAALNGKADDQDLATKADLNHNHAITDVTGLQTALDGKADDADLATKANTTDLAAKADLNHRHNWTDLDQIPASFPAADHDHAILDVTGLQAALDGKAAADHDHAILDVTGLQAALDAKADDADLATKADDADLATKADLIHRHDWAEIDGKPAAYPPEDHDHAEYLTQLEADGRYALRDAEGGTIQSVDWGTITGDIATQADLQTALNGKADDADLAAKADLNHRHNWTDLDQIPASFPAADHDHAILDVTGLQAALDGKADDADLTGKADAIHNHAIAEVTGLQAALDGMATDTDLTTKADLNHSHTFAQITEKPAAYPPEAHDHTIANVTGLQIALDGKADDGDLAAKANTTDLAAKADLIHNHAIADVTGLQAALNGKADDADLAAKADLNHRHNWTDLDQIPASFPAADHDHAITDVTGLQIALDGKADDADLATKADLIHNHAIADVTGLQPALDGKADDADLAAKADAAHNHLIADVTGLQTSLDGKANVNHNHDEIYSKIGHKHDDLYSPIGHNHAIADVTGLQTSLDAKADDADLAAKADLNHNHDLQYAAINHNHDTDYAAIAHEHTIDNVRDLQAALDGKADDADLAAKADLNHGHVIQDVTNLQGILDAKADDADLAAKADLNHAHAIADVTGLQAALDGMATDADLNPLITEAEADVKYALKGEAGNVDLSGYAEKTYVDTADNYILNSVLEGKKVWTGTAEEYNAIATKDPSTIYYATGMGGKNIWTGSQAEYNVASKNSNTLYFITG